MNSNHNCRGSRGKVGAWGVLFTLVVAACGGSEGLSPSAESPTALAPTDSASSADSLATLTDTTLIATDSTAGLPADSSGVAQPSTLTAGVQPGIVFGTFFMNPGDLNAIHTGTLR